MRAQAGRARIGAAMGKGGGVEGIQGIHRRARGGEDGDHRAVARSGGGAVEGLGHPQMRTRVIQPPGGRAVLGVVILDPGMAEGGEIRIVEGQGAGAVAGAERDVAEQGLRLSGRAIPGPDTSVCPLSGQMPATPRRRTGMIAPTPSGNRSLRVCGKEI